MPIHSLLAVPWEQVLKFPRTTVGSLGSRAQGKIDVGWKVSDLHFLENSEGHFFLQHFCLSSTSTWGTEGWGGEAEPELDQIGCRSSLPPAPQAPQSEALLCFKRSCPCAVRPLSLALWQKPLRGSLLEFHSSPLECSFCSLKCTPPSPSRSHHYLLLRLLQWLGNRPPGLHAGLSLTRFLCCCQGCLSRRQRWSLAAPAKPGGIPSLLPLRWNLLPLTDLGGGSWPDLCLSPIPPFLLCQSLFQLTLRWTQAFLPLGLMPQSPLISAETAFLTQPLNQVFPLRYCFIFRTKPQVYPPRHLIKFWEKPRSSKAFSMISRDFWGMLFHASLYLSTSTSPCAALVSILISQAPNPFSTKIHMVWFLSWIDCLY